MSWLSKYVIKPVVNLHRAPDRMLKKAFQGDFKGALSVAASPMAEKQETRDRLLRRKTGVVVGAVGGFITGGPAGAVAGGITGGLRASKGHGKLKDYAGSFVLGAGIGAAAGGAAGALGAPQYGGWAGKMGASLTAPTSTTTGAGKSSLFGSVGKTAGTVGKVAGAVGAVLPMLKPAQPLTEEVPMDFPFASYVPDHPLSSQYVPQGPEAASGSSSNMPLLIGLGALLFLGVFNGK